MPPRDSRMRWPPYGAVRAITDWLRDDYPDDNGRTLVREIVQNADDAEATRLVFAIVGQGASSAYNSLLRGPALLVANDGPFSDKHWDSLHQAIGGSKTDEAEKIGRFGVGLKSVFHLCEAFIYLGAERSTEKSGVVNPWAGTGQSIRDPLHPDWDTVDRDRQHLSRTANALLGGNFPNGLLLWVPLRLKEHCDRGPDRNEDGLGHPHYPTVASVKASFDQPAPLVLLLSQCGHLCSLKAVEAENVKHLEQAGRLVSVARPDFVRRSWVGRYSAVQGQQRRPDKRFDGSIITNDGAGWQVNGIDALGLESLCKLADHPEWPRDYDYQGGVRRSVPRKALAHAAVTVLHGKDHGLVGLRIRWAVGLPLDDAPHPGDKSNVVEIISGDDESDSWEIVLNGYFWPSQNRRSIPGATDGDWGSPGKETHWRSLWNRTLRDELLLPLLPQALEGATGRVSEAAAWSLIERVKQSNLARTHLGTITSSHVLLPVITQTGVQWRTFTEDACFYAVPKWNQAPDSVREAFMHRVGESIFIADDAPRVGGKSSAWPVDQVQLLFGCISSETLGTPEGLEWTEGFVRYVLRRDRVKGQCSVAAASWLAERVGDGALTVATDVRHVEQRVKLRRAWWRLYDSLPHDWLIDAPVDSAPAVAEIALDGNIMGAGLLPIPLGRRAHDDPTAPRSQPDEERLDSALRRLGNGLNGRDVTSQRAYRARLLLAEAFLRVRRDDRTFDDLAQIPLLRARRSPHSEDEAQSLNFLREAAERHRVFAPHRDDSKDAVSFLARALGDSVWMVEGNAASLSEAPGVTTDALARAIVNASSISAKYEERFPLLRYLVDYGARAD